MVPGVYLFKSCLGFLTLGKLLFLPMHQKVLILDFGSQYTQLIARRVRELHIYSEIIPFNKVPDTLDDYQAVILSGSPSSVRSEQAPIPDLSEILNKWFITADLGNHWVFATKRNTCVTYFDDDIYRRQNFFYFFLGFMHMPREPVYCHGDRKIY